MDLRKIKTLLQLMNENGLTDMELEEEGFRIKFSRGPTGGVMVAPAQEFQSALAPAESAAASAAAEPESSVGCLITSPMPGTFYAASSPDQPPFVKVGDIVDEDTVVCIVEAMKVMNEIRAECSGQVVEILVENGEPVEFGKPLLRVV